MQLPPEIQKNYERMLSDGSALELQKRLLMKDASLWSDNCVIQQTIQQRLGWMDCVDLMQTRVDELLEFKTMILDKGFNHCVLLGMGGSSLAPELFSLMFSDKSIDSKMKLDVLDNTSPDVIRQLTQLLDLDKTLFIVASKSGTTIESDSLYRYFYHQVIKNNSADPGRHFVAITDPGTVLEKSASENNFLRCFVNSPDIGGRFSVLSYFGLVPAVLLDIDIRQILDSAQQELRACGHAARVSEATKLGMVLGLGAEKGLDKLFVQVESQLKPFYSWLEQLIAESSGKDSKGILPVLEQLDELTGKNENNFSLMLSKHLPDNDNPAVYSKYFDLSKIGAEFFRWEWATAIAGSIMGINPFDEPNVSENKNITVKLLDSDIEAEDVIIYKKSTDSEKRLQAGIKQLLSSCAATDYFAILIYSADGKEAEFLLQDFRINLKNNYRIASTFGVGPRYLHSTGQLHKGGDNSGIFLIITADSDQHVDIPGKSYDFNRLNRAQALGDIQALKANQRRLLHIHLDRSDHESLKSFANSLAQTTD